MSNLLTKLQVLKPLPTGPGCPVVKLYQELDQETRALLKSQIEESSVSVRQIHLALHAEGYKIARDTVTNHRHGTCICSKDAE